MFRLYIFIIIISLFYSSCGIYPMGESKIISTEQRNDAITNILTLQNDIAISPSSPRLFKATPVYIITKNKQMTIYWSTNEGIEWVSSDNLTVIPEMKSVHILVFARYKNTNSITNSVIYTFCAPVAEITPPSGLYHPSDSIYVNIKMKKTTISFWTTNNWINKHTNTNILIRSQMNLIYYTAEKGLANSDTNTNSYYFSIPSVSATPSSGTYEYKDTMVCLDCHNLDVSFCWSTNEKTSWNISSAIIIKKSKYIKLYAYAFKNNYGSSVTNIFEYRFNLPRPTLNITGGIYSNTDYLDISISHTEPGVSIFWTTNNGTNIHTSSAVHLIKSRTLRTWVQKTGWIDSFTNCNNYIFQLPRCNINYSGTTYSMDYIDVFITNNRSNYQIAWTTNDGIIWSAGALLRISNTATLQYYAKRDSWNNSITNKEIYQMILPNPTANYSDGSYTNYIDLVFNSSVSGTVFFWSTNQGLVWETGNTLHLANSEKVEFYTKKGTRYSQVVSKIYKIYRWRYVGNPRFSAGSAFSIDIAIKNGVPYVLYRDIDVNYDSLTMMRYNGQLWENVGNSRFTIGRGYYPRIACDTNEIYSIYQDCVNGYRANAVILNNNVWNQLGNGFISDIDAYDLSAVVESGIPYISYQDGNKAFKATVMRFNGFIWESVGNKGFTPGQASFTSLRFYNSTPYLAFQDGYNGNCASVMKYNGSSWNYLGNPGFSLHDAYYVSMVICGGTPYVAYSDYDNGSKVSVMRYNGSEWEYAGSSSISISQADYVSQAVENGLPFLAYKDWGNLGKATVKRFNGTEWKDIGEAGFTSTAVNYIALAVYDGIPYVAFQDGGSGNRATVMRFSDR